MQNDPAETKKVERKDRQRSQNRGRSPLDEDQAQEGTEDDTPAALTVPAEQVPHADLSETSEQAHEQGDDDDVVAPQVAAVSNAYGQMLRDIRSWGWMLLLFGAINLIGANVLNAPYGILLLIVALASFYFRESAMYILYAVTLAWAALSNLLSASGAWMFFGVIQVLMAWQVFRAFRRYRGVEQSYRDLAAQGVTGQLPAPQRAGRVFPMTGCLVSALALLGVVVLVLAFIAAIILETNMPGFIDFGAGLVVNVAVLGLAFGLATLASRFQHRVLAALGVAASILVIVSWLGLIALIRLNS